MFEKNMNKVQCCTALNTIIYLTCGITTCNLNKFLINCWMIYKTKINQHDIFGIKEIVFVIVVLICIYTAGLLFLSLLCILVNLTLIISSMDYDDDTTPLS